MIDIHDLCIGNWVYDGERTQFPMYVQAIGEDYVYLNFDDNEGDVFESTPQELQGIPLTRELLQKIGFLQITNLSYELKCVKSEGTYNTIVTFWGDDDIKVQVCRHKYLLVDYHNHFSIRYVHELQNLFWNITKQQLKVNL